jgi:hypothetical protein
MDTNVRIIILSTRKLGLEVFEIRVNGTLVNVYLSAMMAETKAAQLAHRLNGQVYHKCAA